MSVMFGVYEDKYLNGTNKFYHMWNVTEDEKFRTYNLTNFGRLHILVLVINFFLILRRKIFFCARNAVLIRVSENLRRL